MVGEEVRLEIGGDVVSWFVNSCTGDMGKSASRSRSLNESVELVDVLKSSKRVAVTRSE